MATIRKSSTHFCRTALLLLLSLVINASVWAQNSPTGNLEVVGGIHGSIHVKGWCEDPDDLSTPLTVQVYVKDNNNQPVEGYNPIELTANKLRNGEDNQLHNNGYETYLFIATAGTYKVDVIHVDATSDGSAMYSRTGIQVSAPYTVTYNANGGNGAPAQQLKGENIDLTLSTTQPSYGSYGFICWNTASNGGGTSYPSGGTYSGNSNVTLYAMWTASFIPGSGTQSDPYLISSTEQWNLFANNVNNGNTYNGKWVRLGADITVSTMAGRENSPFRGTFDGGGHTMNLAIDGTNVVNTVPSNDQYDLLDVAPFRHVDGATFIDLNLTGYVKATEYAQFGIGLGGLVGLVAEGHSVRILSCRSSVNVSYIFSHYLYGWEDNYTIGNMGGFIGTNAGTVVMDNCLFDGTLSGRPEYVGGFVGRQTPGTMTISNCLMNGSGSGLYGTPQTVKITFCEVPTNAQHLTMTNCYYTTAIGTAQGTQTSNSGEALRAQLGGGWIVNGSGQVVPDGVARYTITIDENIANGTIVSSDAVSIPGETITLTVVPDQGYYGASVTYNDGTAHNLTPDYNECSFTMPEANVTVTGTILSSTVYTITYDLDGGSVATENPTSYTEQSHPFTLVNPTRDGYTFAGWTGTGISGTSLNVTVPHGSSGDRTYTATWAINCTITYNLNGGTLPAPNPTVYSAMSDDITLVAPIRSGYVFSGWTGTELSQATVNVVIPHGSTGNRTYTATWTSTSYTITYNLGGGSVSPSNPTSYTLTTPTFTLNNPTRSGYTFKGWVGTGIDGQAMTVTIPVGSVGNRSYTAIWALNGNVAYQAYNTYTDQFETRYAYNPTAVGTGTSWGSNNSETWYVLNSNVTVDGQISVNGTVNLILYDNCTLTVSNCIHVEAGKTLNIYSQNGGTSGAIVANSSSDHAGIGGGSIGTICIHGGTITANGGSWSAGIGGGTCGGGGTIAIYGGDVKGTAGRPNGNGDARGIGRGSACGGTQESTVIIAEGMRLGSYLYSARSSHMGDSYMRVQPCTTHSYNNGRCKYCNKRQNLKVTYNANNATNGSVPTDATQYSNAGTGTATVLGNTGNLQRTGFVFARWNTAADGSGTSYSAGQTFQVYHDVTLYAYWAEVYPITYDLAGGSLATANPTGYHLFSDNITLNNPTREGYTFVGWTGSNGNTPQQTVVIPAGSIGARTYTANWAPIVHLAVNTDNTQAIAQSSTQPFTTVVLDGYTFRRDGSWNTLCLPFALGNFTGTPLEGATVKTLSASTVTGNTLTASFVNTTSTVTGKPYIVKWEPDLIIRTQADWNTFANNVNSGTESYQGKTVMLAADITVTTMVGTGSNYSNIGNLFRGTFDGCGHTLNLNIQGGSSEGAAPFHYIGGATIKNVKTTGTVSGANHCSGLVGFAASNTVNTIQNCWVDADITCSTTHSSGILGWAYCATVRDCLFSGSITGGTTATGIIYGWGDDLGAGTNHTIINCLATGTYTNCSGLDMLVRYNNRGTPVVTNCYKTQNIGSYGTYTTATGETLRALLGDGWQVIGSTVVPKMVSGIENPMFTNVSISTATQNVTTTYADFVGSYAPFSVGNLLPDTANMVCNAFHGALSIHDVVPPTGYLIGGWYTDAGLTIPATSVTIAPSGEVTLYAMYTPISYTVAFDANTGTGSMTSQSFTYDAAQNLTASTFTRTGYLFAGWSTTTDGPVEYTDGQSVSNLASEDGATVTLYAQWTPITYIVHFDKNHADATGTMADQTLTYDAAQNLNLNTFVRTDYGFYGWSTTDNGSAVYYDGESVLNLADGQDDEVTLYAKWSEAYSITYNLAGGSSPVANPAIYTEFTPTITLVNPTRNGYVFAGWTGTGLSEATMTVTIPIGTTGPREYTATWTPITYSISYDLAGGSTATDNPVTYNIETPTFSLVNPNKAGYTFAGWTGTGLDAASTTVTIALGSTGDRSYTATWTENALTLAADADNNAAITSANGLVYDVTLGGHTLYRDGSWNTICIPFGLDNLIGTPLEGATVKSLESSAYNDGTLTATFTNASTIEAGKPYIAKWDADLIIHTQAEWNTFVSSVNNGTSYEGKVVKLAANFNVNTMVGNSSTNAFKGTLDGCGHTLTLNISVNSSVAGLFRYLNGATIKNLYIGGSLTNGSKQNGGVCGQSYGTVTISNCVVSATITSNFSGDASNGGFVADVRSGSVTMNNCLFSGKMLGNKADNNGGFIGWRNGTGTTLSFNNCLFAPSQITMKTTNSRTFNRAENTNNTYNNIYYKTAFGSTQGVGTQTSATGETLRALLGDGWVVSSGNVVPKMENSISSISNPAFADVTISDATANVTTAYANFVGSYAPITNGLLDSHNPDGNAQHAALTLSDPTTAPTGYTTFIGWYNDADKTVATTSIPFAADGNVTLYAKYTPITYSVHFNKNSDAASGTMENQQFTYDEAQNLSANSFVTSTTGYHFYGWSTTTDGPVVYSDGQSVTNLASQQDAVVDLYAQWTPIDYSITYNLGGGSLTTTHNSYTVNDATITLDEPTRTGYTFAGWYDNSGFTGNAVTSIPTGSTGNVELWAKWTPIVYTITYDLADGNVATPNPTTYTIESEPITLVNPTKDGYVFYGWTGGPVSEVQNSNFEVQNSQLVTIPTGSTGNRSYTAVWALGSITLLNNADNSATIAAADGNLCLGVTLDGYTLYRDGSWNTLCVPFDLNAFAGTPLEGATVKTLQSSAYDDGTLTVNMTNDLTAIEAGTPYIVKWEADLIIHNASEWDAFATNVNNGTDSYQGKTVKLANDISVTTMVGVESHKFQGTFDGCGHTLTVNLSGVGTYGAPFQYLNGATIRNLHTAGSISGTDILQGGIAGRTYGTTRIENCRSSVSLTTTKGDNGAMGGIVGVVESGSVIVTNCLFDGSLLGSSNTNCAGIVNWRRNSASINISNTLFAPAQVTVSTSGAYTIARAGSVTNCYYTQTLGTAQGTSVGTRTATELAAALGSGWQVSGANVVPIMTDMVGELANPVFADVVIDDSPISTFNFQLSTFTGSYAPFNSTNQQINNSTFLDSHNPDGDAQHAALSIVDPAVPTGYNDFENWYTDAERTAVATNIPFDANGNVTLYAKFTPITYTISYELNGGSVATPNPTTYTIESDDITLINPTKDGYVFYGWTGGLVSEVQNSNFEVQNSQLVTIPTGSTGNRSYTAVWALDTITLVGNADNSSTIAAANGDLTLGVTLSGHTLYRDGSWNTICLPFDLDNLTGTPLEGATVKTLSNSSYSEGALTANFGDDLTGIEAGKPYIVKWDDEGLGADLVIRSAADWDAFATNVNNGTDNYQGKTVKLAADISVTTMVGTNGHEFKGTFDGCGHTLNDTLSGSGSFVAPFSYVNGCTIKNLIVTGEVNGGIHCSGLIGCGGSTANTSLIENCDVRVAVKCNQSTHCGGFIGHSLQGTFTFRNCKFSGSISGAKTYTGVFMGWAGQPATHINCLAAGTYSYSGTLVISKGTNTYTNCYTTQSIGSDCTHTTATGETLRALLGDGWEVVAGNVVPKMENTVGNIANPLFADVTINSTTQQLNISTTHADFTGSYAPFNSTNQQINNSTILDSHNPDGDAQHAALIISEPTPPTGYDDFAGWFTDAELTQAIAIPNSQLSILNYQVPIILYAKWNPNTYTVHFNKNNDAATGTMDDQTFTYDEAQPLSPNGFTVTGNFDFAGWSTSTGGSVEFTDGQNVMNLAAEQGTVVNLYAIWTTIYTIDYDLAGGSVAGENPATYSEYSSDITLVNPTRDYYDFAGWTGTDLTEATMTVTIPTGSTGNRSYTATWTPIEYSITYNGVDGATFASDNPTTYNIESGTITLNNPTREGYTFAGWTGGLDSEIQNSNFEVQNSQLVTIAAGSTGDRSYTATWTPVTYTVRFNKNNDAATGTMADQTMTYDVAQNLSANGFSATTVGYVFAGWSTTADGEVVYSDGHSVSNLASQQDAVVNLYAQWAPIAYSITYNLGGGSIPTTNPETYTTESEAITLVNPTRTGYTFTGWTGGLNSEIQNSNFEVQNSQLVTIPTGSTGDRTYTANWTPITYSVRFNKNNDAATGTMNDQQFTYDVAQNLTANAFTITGYSFTGWSTTANGSVVYSDGESVNNLTTVDDAVIDLYAQWVITDYSITYNLSGANSPAANPTSYTIESEAITLVNPTRTGYTFTGWTGSNGDTPETTVTIPAGSTGNLSYTAHWTPITYTITYDLANGTTPAANPATYNIESEPITLVNPEREGYYFVGWTGTGLATTTATVVIPTGSTGNRSYTANWIDYGSVVPYLAYNTTSGSFETQMAQVYTEITSSTTTMADGWYVVNSNISINSRIEVTGTVNLILCDGKTLTVPRGLHVPSGVTLNIYGQGAGTGSITISGSGIVNCAGIGGNNSQNGGTLSIHGGIVTTKGGSAAPGIGGGKGSGYNGGTVAIYGGTVNATGGNYGAGIGGGDNGGVGCISVVITGGTVDATGNNGGAGIGGGWNGNGGNSVVITGGIVNATGGGSTSYNGAGIGGGRNGAGCTTVTITGGIVTAIAGNSSAQAIGRGQGSSASGTLASLGETMVFASTDAAEPVAMRSRESTCRSAYAKLMPCTEHHWVENTCTWCGATCNGVAYGRNHATSGTAPVDNTNYTDGQTVTVLENTGNLERSGFTYAGWNSAADGSGNDYAAGTTFAYSESVTIYAKWTPVVYNITYNLDGGTVTTPNPTTYSFNDEITLNNPTKEGCAFVGWTGTGIASNTMTVIIPTGSTGDRYYTANWQPELEYRAYNTTVHDFETLTANAFYDVNSSTTEMSGGWYAVRSNTTISSRIEMTGTVNLILCDGVTLTAPKGIHVKSGVTLNIYGQSDGTGALTISNVDHTQAAIGGNSSNANHEDGGTVTIHGGNITASGYYGAGIGGSDYGGNGGTVTIYGGNIAATSASQGAGIGGGYNGNGGTVTIMGGTVTATGGSDGGAGIGGGYNKGGGSVTITGGTVIAIAGNSSAQAIGRGQGSSGSGSLTLGDMKVYASANATEPVTSGSRESTCRSTYAKLLPCTEHNWVNNACTLCGAVNHGIAYGRNNATSGTVPVDATNYAVNQTVTVLGNTGNLERTGHTYAGWNTTADGMGTTYAANDTFLFSAPVTLYAKWNLITYSISYNGIDGATFATPNPANYSVESDSITLVNPTKEGYVFYGWTGGLVSDVQNSNFEVQNSQLVTIPTGSTGNRSYTAVWALDTITLLNNADNSSAIAAANGNLSLGVTLSGHTLYRDGSWNTLCVPFDLNAFAGTPLEGATVKTLQSSAYDDGTLTMNMTNDLTAIEAGTPYIVKWSEPDFVISSQADWNTFANNIGNYQNKTVKLATDISVTSMVSGTFNGTLDGCGHTITLSLSGGNEELALFTTLQNATIKNLKIEGTINFNRHRPASIASYIAGTTTIMNCWSSVTITSNYNPSSADWVDGGAFVARVNSGATLNMSDCLFTGSVTYNAKNNQGGGMVGWAQGSTSVINLTHCLFAPSAMTMTATDPKNKTYVFVSGEARGNLTGCYYNTVAQNVNASVLRKDGTYTTATGEALRALLGNGWKVIGESVVPKMANTINDEANPVFANVTIDDSPLSTLNSQLSTFFGSYAPITNGLLDSHNPNGDAQHAALSIADPTVAPTGYDDFVGWFTDAECTAAVSAIPFSADGSVTLYAKWEPVEYSITYSGLEGASLASSNPDTYTIESPDITLNNPTKEGYTFTGWTGSNGDTPQTTVTIATGSTGDKSYTANWTFNTYTITFENWDGTTLQSSQVAYGETPAYTGETPTRAADAQYTYTFTGWSPAIATVTGNATYTAQYSTTVNTYTITFEDWDGTELQSGQMAYGETPVYTGATPTRAADVQYTYTFTGWSPAIATVTGNATYTAQYGTTVNEYTITFVNYDNTVLQTGQMAYGETPTYTGETPTRAATSQYIYTFTGWSPEIVAVTANATYTAQYTAVEMLHDVPYRAYNTTSQQFETLTATTCSRINSQLSTLNSQLSGGWYAVNSDVTIGSKINLTGTVNLILCDGATLTAEQGFKFVGGATLNIYGQTGGTGTLASGNDITTDWSSEDNMTVHGGNFSLNGHRGISINGDIAIYGGDLDFDVTGSAISSGDCNVTIYGGNIDIDALDQYSTGIYVQENSSVVINGGTINITANDGILAYYGNSFITINGGDITFNSTGTASHSTGIGTNGGDLTINGGNVSCTIQELGYGSACFDAWDGDIVINGGNISATVNDNPEPGNEGFGFYTHDGDIILGWTSSNDRIFASSYEFYENGGSLSIKDGQSFWNGTESVSGTITDFSKVNGLTLIPNTTTDVAIALAAGWQAISSPMFNNTDNSETIADVSGLTTGVYDMLRYNESTGTWENQKASTGTAAGFTTIERGRGYIYRRNTATSLTFFGQLHTGNFAYAGTDDVDSYGDITAGCPDANLTGFHLVGNPYSHVIYKGVGMTGTSLSSGYYELRPDGTWLVHTDSDPIAVGQAVLVKATQACELSFTDDASKSIVNYQLSTLNSQLSFSVTDGTHTDIAYAVLESLVTDHSSLKKILHLEPNLPTLSIPQGTDRYSIAAFDMATEQFELDFTAPNGTYTLQLNSEELKDNSYLHLIDRATGKDIDLLSHPTYTFTHSITQSLTPRFLVKLSQDNSQLSTVNSQFAYQQGDHIVITATGTLQAFDLLGRRLFTKEISTLNSQLSTLNFPSTGVYLLRLNDKTQKIVIK